MGKVCKLCLEIWSKVLLERVFRAESNSWWIDWSKVDLVRSGFSCQNRGRVATRIVSRAFVSENILVLSRLLSIEMLRDDILVKLRLLKVSLLGRKEVIH